MNLLPRLPEIDAWIVDDCVKGYPGGAGPRPLREIGQSGWNVLRGDVPFPVAVLKASALENNRKWMNRFVEALGVELAPHGKTTMSPQLFHAQLADGAWGMTCATISQLQVYRRFGVQRVLIANQVVGSRNIGYLLDESMRDPEFEPYVLVDSVEGVELLAAAARNRRIPRPLRVLMEIGQPGVRTGARDLTHVRRLLTAIESTTPWLALHGVECYEGAIKAPPDAAPGAVREMLNLQTEAARLVAASQAARTADPFILSAGGSEYFDIVALALRDIDLGRRTSVVLRSGCYIVHDHLAYAQAFERLRARQPSADWIGTGLAPALEIWTVVQSRPEPTRAYAAAGKRDLSHDMQLPVAIGWLDPQRHSRPKPPPDLEVIALNDQHVHLRLPADSPLRVGQLIGFGVAHPCTTFDKWQLIYVVDDPYRIVDAIRTYF